MLQWLPTVGGETRVGRGRKPCRGVLTISAHHATFPTVAAVEGPEVASPPAVSNETKAAIQAGSQSDQTGAHATGPDAGTAQAPTKVKSEKERMSGPSQQ